MSRIEEVDYLMKGIAMEKHVCCICGKEFTGYGNNPAPVKESGVCCDECNASKVIPVRIAMIFNDK